MTVNPHGDPADHVANIRAKTIKANQALADHDFHTAAQLLNKARDGAEVAYQLFQEGQPPALPSDEQI
jgi:hypothetical protein